MLQCMTELDRCVCVQYGDTEIYTSGQAGTYFYEDTRKHRRGIWVIVGCRGSQRTSVHTTKLNTWCIFVILCM